MLSNPKCDGLRTYDLTFSPRSLSTRMFTWKFANRINLWPNEYFTVLAVKAHNELGIEAPKLV